MNQPGLPFDAFYSLLTIILSGIAGILIGVPASSYLISTGALNPTIGFFVLIFFGLAGARIGYRRRNNRSFFYLSFFAVLVLSSLIGFSFVDTNH